MEREDARKLSPDAQREGRRQVVRAYKRGVNRRRIARELGLSYSSVRMIVQRFRQDGMRGIESGQRGRPAGSCRTLSPEQEEQIQRLICDQRPEQLKLDFALWTRAAVMLLIERQVANSYQFDNKHRVLNRLNASSIDDTLIEYSTYDDKLVSHFLPLMCASKKHQRTPKKRQCVRRIIPCAPFIAALSR